MENYLLINDFIEGKLEPGKEELLFMHLTNDEELRTEFKQLISMNTVIKNNRKLFNYNPSSKLKVFTAVGLGVTGAIGTASASGIKSTKIISTAIKAKALIWGAASAVIGGTVVYLLMNSAINTGNTYGNNFIRHSKYQQQIPMETNRSEEPELNKKVITKYIYIEKPEEVTQNTASSQNFELDDVLPKNIETITENQETEMIPEINKKPEKVELKPMVNTIDEPSANLNKNILNGLSIEFRNNIDFHIPIPTIEPAQQLKYNNMNFAIMYALLENLNIGLDIRQENFYMEYTGIGTEGLKRTYQQQPNFTSYDIFIRWLPLNIDWFKAGGQLSFGANVVGYLCRGGLNCVLFPGNNLNFTLGIENSWLFYDFKENWFNSKKLNINYGLQYNF